MQLLEPGGGRGIQIPAAGEREQFAPDHAPRSPAAVVIGGLHFQIDLPCGRSGCAGGHRRKASGEEGEQVLRPLLAPQQAPPQAQQGGQIIIACAAGTLLALSLNTTGMRESSKLLRNLAIAAFGVARGDDQIGPERHDAFHRDAARRQTADDGNVASRLRLQGRQQNVAVEHFRGRPAGNAVHRVGIEQRDGHRIARIHQHNALRPGGSVMLRPSMSVMRTGISAPAGVPAKARPASPPQSACRRVIRASPCLAQAREEGAPRAVLAVNVVSAACIIGRVEDVPHVEGRGGALQLSVQLAEIVAQRGIEEREAVDLDVVRIVGIAWPITRMPAPVFRPFRTPLVKL